MTPGQYAKKPCDFLSNMRKPHIYPAWARRRRRVKRLAMSVCLYVCVQKTGPFAVCRLGLALQYFSTAVLTPLKWSTKSADSSAACYGRSI